VFRVENPYLVHINLLGRHEDKKRDATRIRGVVAHTGNYRGLQLAGGLKKLSRGRKKFLASGWTLKFAYAPHIQDLTSGWKSFGPYAKHMPRALSEATIKFTSGYQSLVDAYAQHQLSTKKHR